MDSERLIIGEEAAAAINKAKRTGKKVVAVGVTVMRGLETYVTTSNARAQRSVPRLGRSIGEGIVYALQYAWASLVAQLV